MDKADVLKNGLINKGVLPYATDLSDIEMDVYGLLEVAHSFGESALYPYRKYFIDIDVDQIDNLKNIFKLVAGDLVHHYWHQSSQINIAWICKFNAGWKDPNDNLTYYTGPVDVEIYHQENEVPDPPTINITFKHNGVDLLNTMSLYHLSGTIEFKIDWEPTE